MHLTSRYAWLACSAALLFLAFYACANEYAPPDKAAALAAVKALAVEAAGEKKIDVWVTLFGKKEKTEVAKASEKFLSVKVAGNVFDQQWEKISAEEIAGIAKSCVLGKGRRALVMADYCLAAGLSKQADDALTLAAELDGKNLAAEIAARQKAISGASASPASPAKPAPAAAGPQKPADAPPAPPAPPAAVSPLKAPPPAPTVEGAFRTNADGVYEALDREPTATETLLLEFMNRFRADPSAEADRIAPDGKQGGGVDWKMFREEMKALKPVPPLVFSLELLDAARKHSHYMVLNGLTHTQEAGKRGYVAAGFGERCAKSGYKGFAGGENCFRDPGDPWGCHAGFVVDFGGGGTGGMQAGRGHRTNMHSPGSREAGPGAVPHDGRVSVTYDFGSRKGGRLAGGVIYLDLNGNKFYDLGEGLGGIMVTASDGRAVKTWKSGAYTLELKGAASVALAADVFGERFAQNFSAGGENVKFDWAVPVDVPLKLCDKLLAAVEAVKDPATPQYIAAQVNLYIGAEGLYLDEAHRARVEELTRDIAGPLAESQKTVLDALESGDMGILEKAVAESRKPYRGTMADAWFADAELIGRLRQGAANFEKSQPGPKERQQFAASLEQAGARIVAPRFKQELAALVAKAQ